MSLQPCWLSLQTIYQRQCALSVLLIFVIIMFNVFRNMCVSEIDASKKRVILNELSDLLSHLHHNIPTYIDAFFF